jgi:hypothetical protein
MNVLSQSTLRWITDKAISIINMEDEEVEREENHKFEKDLYVKDEKEAIVSLDTRITHLKDVLGGLKDG